MLNGSFVLPKMLVDDIQWEWHFTGEFPLNLQKEFIFPGLSWMQCEDGHIKRGICIRLWL
jgi:hypothetical protein